MKRVEDIFEVRYGHSLELNRMRLVPQKDGIAFVSRKMGDNGISAYVKPIKGVVPASAGELSCALGGNGVLTTFIQEEPFYTGRDVARLIPRVSLTRPKLLYYCFCIRANRFRYSYGRQANRSLKDIAVPDVLEIPDWVDQVNVNMYEGATAPLINSGALKLEIKKWRSFEFDDLFEIKKGKRLTKANMAAGSTPFIGATEYQNGVTAMIGQKPIHDGNTISVSYNGSVAEAFYQPDPYWATDDVNVLYPKFELTPAIGLFLATIIRQEKYRFSYGRKWHMERMRKSTIKLPVKSNVKPDWDYMEKFILSLPYSSRIG